MMRMGIRTCGGDRTAAVHGTADSWSSRHLAFHVAVDAGGVLAFVNFRVKLKNTPIVQFVATACVVINT